MWKEIFKTGKHRDANGNEHEWSREDLDVIVAKYNNQPLDTKHEAPVVIGHPVTNSPAYGWVEKLKRNGDVLLAKFKQLDRDFKDLIQKGRFKKVSIALYPDLMLRHVGYLGAIPPAVKGLKDTEFNLEQDCLIFEFEQNDDTTSTILEQNVNDTLIIPKQNVNTAKQNINTVQTNLNKYKNNIYHSPSRFSSFEGDENVSTYYKIINLLSGGNMPVMIMFEDYKKLSQELLGWLSQTFNEEIANQTQGKLNELEAKYLKPIEPMVNSVEDSGNLNEENEKTAFAQSKEFQELQKKLKKLEDENREIKFNEYFNSQLGRLVPSQKHIVKLAFDAVKDNTEGFQFSEGGKTVHLTGEELIKRLIESFPVQVEFNEIATKELLGFSDAIEKQNKFIDEYYRNK